MRNGFIFDLNKCVGCEACVVACQIENRDTQSEAWRRISPFNSFQHPALPLFHFSLACNHCDDPTCLAGCPAGAYTKDRLLQTVDHHQELCIGCRYCTWTCPYDAPKFVALKGVIEKCTLCRTRIVEGRKPNCANLCPTGALDYGNIEADVNRIRGFTEKGLGPGITIVPLRNNARPLVAPAPMNPPERSLYGKLQLAAEPKVNLRIEWTLVVFTMLVACLFGVVSASMIRPAPIDPISFLVLGCVGMALSTVHLGKRMRAWRALLNIRSSWISREVTAFFLFLISFVLNQTYLTGMVMGVLSLMFGLATLVSIDMVYIVAERRSMPIEKSGSIVLTGLLFFGLLGQVVAVFAVVLALKCVLYVNELVKSGPRNLPRIALAAVRIAAGFILPLLLVSTEGDLMLTLLVVSVGESINRIEFYLDLDFITPRRQIQLDLAKALGLTPLTSR